MIHFVVLVGLAALSSAQFPQPAYLDIPGVTPPPWQGPIADHVNGIPPKDTPEVVAAKAALNEAYTQVLAVLPELPPEERYRPDQETPAQYVPVPQQVPQYLGHQHIVPQHHHPLERLAPTTKTFAEEIPRSPLGEVPEVHAARVAHLKAYQEVVATLPRLADTTSTVRPVIHQHPGLFQDYLLNQQVQDTPEVAKAKAEHAAAVAAALG